MTLDRYTKAVLTVIAVALVVIAARPLLPASGWPDALQLAPAQAQSMAAREATIPKSWGKFVSYSGGNLQLEGSDRSVRIVDLDGKPPEYPKLKWIIKFE
ncbi:MAG: hypothetical protein DMD96_17520 [Candidatus Rokuibacteriota bacterium]|nr:MAG: hypothetical protein DMD96_17520 [Candidatus Rokubacteria bacterium]